MYKRQDYWTVSDQGLINQCCEMIKKCSRVILIGSNEMMDLTEGIISNAANEVCGTYELEYKGNKISLAPDVYKRQSVCSR